MILFSLYSFDNKINININSNKYLYLLEYIMINNYLF